MKLIFIFIFSLMSLCTINNEASQQSGGCSGYCGDIDNPPTKSNMTLWGIFELGFLGINGFVYSGCRGIKFFLDKKYDVCRSLELASNIFNVLGGVATFVGLFCCINQGTVVIGICFFFGSFILSVISTILSIISGEFKNNIASSILRCVSFVLSLCLSCVLWRQKARL